MMKHKLGLNFDASKFVNAPVLRNFIRGTLPSPQAEADWSPIVTVPWGMDGNDTLGDCFYAGFAHQIMLWTAGASNIVVPSTQDVLDAYSRGTGYDPSDPNSDNGTDPMVGIRDMQQFGISLHRIGPHAIIPAKDWEMGMIAIDTLGCVGLCLNFLDVWQDAVIWDDDPKGKVVGGHYVPAIGHDSYQNTYVEHMTIITWGQPRLITRAALAKYGQLMIAVLSPDWIVSGQSPDVYDKTALESYIAQMARYE
jgi:hypothetical protein